MLKTASHCEWRCRTIQCHVFPWRELGKDWLFTREKPEPGGSEIPSPSPFPPSNSLPPPLFLWNHDQREVNWSFEYYEMSDRWDCSIYLAIDMCCDVEIKLHAFWTSSVVWCSHPLNPREICLVGKAEGKSLRRPRRRWEDIKMDLRDIGL